MNPDSLNSSAKNADGTMAVLRTNVAPSALRDGSSRTLRFGVPLCQANGGMIRFSRICWKIVLNMSSESMQAWKPALRALIVLLTLS
jgi:hypothetical protein